MIAIMMHYHDDQFNQQSSFQSSLGASPSFSRTVSGRGIRVLAMDGGGIRGLVLVELLRKIELDSGR